MDNNQQSLLLGTENLQKHLSEKTLISSTLSDASSGEGLTTNSDLYITNPPFDLEIILSFATMMERLSTEGSIKAMLIP